LEGEDFVEGGLQVASNVRPNHLFTADESIVQSKAGRFTRGKWREVADGIEAMLDAAT
jgi:mRNA interferase MazF